MDDEEDLYQFEDLPAGRYLAWLCLEDAEQYGPVPFEIGDDGDEPLVVEFPRGSGEQPRP